MNSLFRKLIFGDAGIREYATITINGPIQEKVYLQIGAAWQEISQNHWLLCLDPIVFGIWISCENDMALAGGQGDYKMHFTNSSINADGNGNILAEITLDLFDKIPDKAGFLLLLKLKKTRIYHINFLRTRLIFLKYYKKPQLSFAKLKSFVSAYSYPRRVRIISFKQYQYYNIFPMDLLGEVGQHGKFVFGLRHSNIALSKIIDSKKIVVSEVSYRYKDIIYQLGSHHSAAPPAVDRLPFKVISSRRFGFYVPEWVDSYKEVRIIKTINLGSHMLLWGEVLDECALRSPAGHLYHIHYLLYLFQKRNHMEYPAV
jgi:hypothetical protein